jgi:hypothetical protein
MHFWIGSEILRLKYYKLFLYFQPLYADFVFFRVKNVQDGPLRAIVFPKNNTTWVTKNLEFFDFSDLKEFKKKVH